MGEHPLAHYRRKRAQRGHIRAPTHQKKKKKEFTEVFPEARWTAKTTNRKEPLAEGTRCEKGLCLQSSRVSQALGLDENNFAKVW